MLAFFLNEKSFGTQRPVESTDSILITGASSGIGRHAALALNAIGFKVFVGVRKLKDFEKVVTAAVSPDRMFPVILDVTKDEHFVAAIEQVEKEVGDAGLTAIYGNAGMDVPGKDPEKSSAVEFSDLEAWKKLFDVNVFGNIRLIKSFLPLLRKSKKGRIIFNTSIAGLNGCPFLTPYSASKWAMEGVCLGLRGEVAPFNIAVSCLEPGFVRSRLMVEGIDLLYEKIEKVESIYPQEAKATKEFLAGVPTATSPKCTSDLLIDAVLSSRPNHRYTCGGFSLIGNIISKLPSQVTEFLSANSPEPEIASDDILAVKAACLEEDFKASDYVSK